MSGLLRGSGGLRTLSSTSTVREIQAFWSARPGSTHVPKRLYGQLAAAQEFIRSSLRSIGEFASAREDDSAVQHTELCLEEKTCIEDGVSHAQTKASSQCNSSRQADFCSKRLNETSMEGSDNNHGTPGSQVASPSSMLSSKEATTDWELGSESKQSCNSFDKSSKVALDAELRTKQLDDGIVVKGTSNFLPAEGLTSKTDESTVELDEKLTSFGTVDLQIDKASGNTDLGSKIMGPPNLLPVSSCRNGTECVGKQQTTSLDGGPISESSTRKNSAKVPQQKSMSTSSKCCFDSSDNLRDAPTKTSTATSKQVAADCSDNLDKTTMEQEELDAHWKAHGSTVPVTLSEKQGPCSEPLTIDGVPDLCYTVCVKNLPASSDLFQLRTILSDHGEIVRSSRKRTTSGRCDCFFQFKTEGAWNSALAARKLMLENCIYDIRQNKPITTVVRISGVSPQTTESEILSVCKQFGALGNISRRRSGVYDVYYHATEQPNIPKIIRSLQTVTLNNSKWMSIPVAFHVVTKPAPNGKEEVRKDLKMGETLEKLEKGLHSAILSFQDLKALFSMQEGLEHLRK